MANLSNQEKWQQEYAKLKAHGFKWRFAGIVEGKKQWQLYTSAGEPISKAAALAEIAEIEREKKEWEVDEELARIESSIYELCWTGDFSEEVRMSHEIVAIHDEGDSYVIFPAEVHITEKGDITRYTLPSGKVFIMRDTILSAEGEGDLMEDPDTTDEMLLLTCSPVIHDVAMKQLIHVLELTVTNIDGEPCFLADVRIDEVEHKIYGRGHKIQTYGEYV